METFLTSIALHFGDTPESIMLNALRFSYKLDDMVYILYTYTLNVKDPFLEEEYYKDSLKKQGIRHIINTLYSIWTLVCGEHYKEVSSAVMLECKMSSGIITED